MIKPKNKEMISIQVTAQEKEKIQQAAANCDLSVSEFIRLSLNNDARSYAELKHENTKLKQIINQQKVKLHYADQDLVGKGNIILKTNPEQLEVLKRLYGRYLEDELCIEDMLLVALIDTAFTRAYESFTLMREKSDEQKWFYEKEVGEHNSLAEIYDVSGIEAESIFKDLKQYMDIKRTKVEYLDFDQESQ